jgi:hypothetical protein
MRPNDTVWMLYGTSPCFLFAMPTFRRIIMSLSSRVKCRSRKLDGNISRLQGSWSLGPTGGGSTHPPNVPVNLDRTPFPVSQWPHSLVPSYINEPLPSITHLSSEQGLNQFHQYFGILLQEYTVSQSQSWQHVYKILLTNFKYFSSWRVCYSGL